MTRRRWTRRERVEFGLLALLALVWFGGMVLVGLVNGWLCAAPTLTR